MNARKLRPMQSEDIEAVAKLNRAVTPYPWTASQFKESLDQHDCSVLVVNKRLLGFIVFQHVCGESCLLNIAVHSDFHRQGYAKLLLNVGLQSCLQQQSEQCYLEVRESNLAAINLYEQAGFVSQGLRKNYYPSDVGREHAKVLVVPLNNIGVQHNERC